MQGETDGPDIFKFELLLCCLAKEKNWWLYIYFPAPKKVSRPIINRKGADSIEILLLIVKFLVREDKCSGASIRCPSLKIDLAMTHLSLVYCSE